MGAPPAPKTEAPPPPPDLAKSQLAALSFAETQRKLRRGTGRRSTFLTGGVGDVDTSTTGQNTRLGA